MALQIPGGSFMLAVGSTGLRLGPLIFARKEEGLRFMLGGGHKVDIRPLVV